ncbi:hypothetical protein [Rhizobium leguminosarum]|uniref:hypothetical protein n=1 Tax=Rhizobium leguminosarum TaxID=384 RepID=UPI001C95BC4E|nr:hypothetical protein [Rhizobium leguminosarum]MBY5809389.1 hypothetical protein [Rhizobium leguminosarum]
MLGMRDVGDRILLRLSKSTIVDGLWVGVSSDENAQEVLSRVRQALHLIKTYDPCRYKRVQCELQSILISYLFGAAGIFNPKLRRCNLDVDFVMTSPPEVIASTIIHESTHGYLHRRNIPYHEEIRHRVERACIHQEMAFAKKVPDAHALMQNIEHTLELPPETWSRTGIYQLRRAALVSADVRFPRWLHRALIWAFDRRNRSGRRR